MKETKIYMELPSSCDECPIEHCGEYCTLNGVEIDTWSYSDKRPKYCPLIDIKDHNRELVAKVLKEVEDSFTAYLPLRNRTGAWFYGRLNEIKKEFEDGE